MWRPYIRRAGLKHACHPHLVTLFRRHDSRGGDTWFSSSSETYVYDLFKNKFGEGAGVATLFRNFVRRIVGQATYLRLDCRIQYMDYKHAEWF